MAKFAEAAEAYNLEEKEFFEETQSAYAYSAYTYGSAAPAYEPVTEPAPQQKPEKEKKPAVRPRVSRAERQIRGYLTGMTLLIAVGALLIVGMCATNFVKKNQLSALYRELDTARLQTQMVGETETEVFNLTEIRTYALDELGMRNAGAGEVISVTAVFGAYTEDYTVAQSSQQTVGFHWFGN